MRVLTVQQPWAWAIVEGGKDVENRTQAWGYRGPLAIHAGARRSERGDSSPLIEQATSDASYFDDDPIRFTAMGTVIGVVDLIDVHHCVHSGGRIDCCDSPWAETSYDEHGGYTRRELVHLVLANPRPLPTPIPARGRLGLWTPDPDLLNQLQEARR